MKSVLIGVAILLIMAGTATRLYHRWREEAADHRVMILVDWAEVRDEALRQGMTDDELLERLKSAGASALLVGASTVQDYLWQDMTFTSRALAETVLRQLEERGVVGVRLKGSSQRFQLVNSYKNWERLKDVEVGFNPELLGKACQAGFHLVLRVNHDPWLDKDKLFGDLAEIASSNVELGFLLNTDEVPGGADALPQWESFLASQNYLQLLFEFHPSKSTMSAAYGLPQATYRAHTISPLELKDLSPAEQWARWRRAVQERSCRFLLFHLSPSDSLTSFLETMHTTREGLEREGWEVAWPRYRLAWAFPTLVERQWNPLLALVLAIVVPIAALRAGLGGNPWKSFFFITLMSAVGACVMAALADNPLARIEVVPFRGIKVAFVLAWAGSFFALYTWKEMESQLFQTVRRVDILAGLGLIAVAAYFIVRTGNAGAGWKGGWEQNLRDRLEDLLVARPRFKEFAIGYPLLILGLHMHKERLGRLLVGLGMIGPISMINTFCHLHSPLYLAFWRSFNGLALGAVIGLGLVTIEKCRS